MTKKFGVVRVFALVLFTAPALAQGEPAADQDKAEEVREILDREFTIGPRLGAGYLTDDADFGRLSLDVGAELRKEMGRVIFRASTYLSFAGSDVFGVGLDVGPGFYLSNGRVAPWLGVDVGLRIGYLTEPGGEMPFGFGGYLAGGVVLRRDHSTRIHLGFQGGAAFMTIQPMSVAGQWGVPNPSRTSYILGQATFIAAVGF